MSIATSGSTNKLEWQDGANWARLGLYTTLFVWVYDGLVNTANDVGLRVFKNLSTGAHQINLYPDTDSGYGNRCFSYGRGYSTNPGAWNSGFGSFPRGTHKWHCIAITMDASSTATSPVFYLNGQLMSTVAGPFNPQIGTATDALTTESTRFMNDGSNVFDCSIAHIAAWNYIMKQSEVVHVMKRGPLAIPNGLKLYYPFDAQQPGGRLTPLVGRVGPMTAPLLSARDHGDPYNHQYVGAWGRRTLSYQNHRARAKQISRTYVPVSATSNSGWLPGTDATRIAALTAVDSSEASTVTPGASMTMELG